MSFDVQQVQPGWAVYGNDNQKIGDVTGVGTNYVQVEKGTLFPSTYYVPADEIQQADPAQGYLVVPCTKDDFDSMGWTEPPAETGTTATTDASASVGGSGRTATTGGTQRIPRYEEELRAEKSTQPVGEVDVSKRVTQDRQEFDVPVTREGVEVRRTQVNRPASGDERAFQEGDTIRVPVTAEQVNVTKEPRVVEEIEVRKTAAQDTEHVSDTVRREEFDVQKQGDVRKEYERPDDGRA